jgi:adenosylmethionine-8-amino-7-oxononanoate aminotransferase
VSDTHVIHRSLRATPPVAVGGEGVWLIDFGGKRYLDASGGAAVSCLGHGHPDVRAAMHAQIDQLAYAHTGFFTSEVAETLADHLAARAPAGLSNVYFVSGGSEGVEAALKMARQHFVEKGEPERSLFVARRQSYHGNTLGALAVGGNEWRRRQFAPLLIDVLRVAPCYAYRDQRADESEAQYTQRLLDELDATISAAGPKRVRPPRRALDRRRGDVRHGPHRHAARRRSGECDARPDGARQGPGRWLPADRRRARA